MTLSELFFISHLSSYLLFPSPHLKRLEEGTRPCLSLLASREGQARSSPSQALCNLPTGNPRGKMPFIADPFHRWGNGCSEELRNLPEITQL